MSWQTILFAILILLWATAQYGLAVYALRDLNRQPRVRGNNKVLWGLVILAVPIAGPLSYSVYGPTSFIRRPAPRLAAAAPTRRKTGTTTVTSSRPRPRTPGSTAAPTPARRSRPQATPPARPAPREDPVVADGPGPT